MMLAVSHGSAKSRAGGTLKRKPGVLPDDPLIDNNILTRLAAGDAEAARFANRRRGLLSVTQEVIDQFEIRHGHQEFQRVQSEFEITTIPTAPHAEVLALMQRLNITSLRHATDISLLAAARRTGIGLVTADHQLFSAALRSGYRRVEFRIFEGTATGRINAIRQAQVIARQFARGESVHRFTGSGIGR
jgi:predicted nucleic acid-binding protein